MTNDQEGPLRLEFLRGSEVLPRLQELAALRIEIFREWPYLYAGNEEAESQYLRFYAECPDSLVLLVWDGGRCVGASTSLPLAAAHDDIRRPWLASGEEISRLSYIGEVILRPAYRGRGLGVRFFHEHENHARKTGLLECCFCTVERDADDRRKPADAVDLRGFWERRRYRLLAGVTCQLSWLDSGDSAPTPKLMQFWIRRLGD
ncbi:MAG: hypothetical protein RL095_3202 [Verrucomicrobiota bacterium]|jgi:GNAT superfamily N-acetyltransferase